MAWVDEAIPWLAFMVCRLACTWLQVLAGAMLAGPDRRCSSLKLQRIAVVVGARVGVKGGIGGWQEDAVQRPD